MPDKFINYPNRVNNYLYCRYSSDLFLSIHWIMLCSFKICFIDLIFSWHAVYVRVYTYTLSLLTNLWSWHLYTVPGLSLSSFKNQKSLQGSLLCLPLNWIRAFCNNILSYSVILLPRHSSQLYSCVINVCSLQPPAYSTHTILVSEHFESGTMSILFIFLLQHLAQCLIIVSVQWIIFEGMNAQYMRQVLCLCLFHRL